MNVIYNLQDSVIIFMSLIKLNYYTIQLIVFYIFNEKSIGKGLGNKAKYLGSLND